jgi:hypothetical protein
MSECKKLAESILSKEHITLEELIQAQDLFELHNKIERLCQEFTDLEDKHVSNSK